MNHYLEDRGVQASIASGVVIGAGAAIFADQYWPAWIVLGAAWAIATTVAVVMAHGKRTHA
jgi:hypothetical protein